MHDYQPFSVIGFHSCDKAVGMRVLIGQDELLPSQNSWDWLGEGIYFWEQNPLRAVEYAVESAQRKQFNKKPIEIPFVIGAIIDLGNCLNLTESGSLKILSTAYTGLKLLKDLSGEAMPVTNGNNRALDCAVIEYLHQTQKVNNQPQFDTVRCAFPEGEQAYSNSFISSRLHMQICVRNAECIKGFFIPRPIGKYNSVN
ncbi:MAG: hypothetical protein H7257_07725 [Taibaiella sp.]|nr:hypothetical protein [Taibaiella sp.]